VPTVLLLLGWRFFFYANERGEPPHIHCRKGGAEAKYWLAPDAFEATEAFAYGMTPGDRRTVRKIIFENFDYLIDEWQKFQEGRDE
jgi:hypothetical protein